MMPLGHAAAKLLGVECGVWGVGGRRHAAGPCPAGEQSRRPDNAAPSHVPGCHKGLLPAGACMPRRLAWKVGLLPPVLLLLLLLLLVKEAVKHCLGQAGLL